MARKFICIKQHDITDCGAACLATILKQHSFLISITKIREIAGTDKQGTNVCGVIKAAEQLGFTAKGVKGDYVVIHKITKKHVIIADPAKGIIKLTPEDFFGEGKENKKPPRYQWSGVLVLLVPNIEFKKGDETEGTEKVLLIRLKQKAL